MAKQRPQTTTGPVTSVQPSTEPPLDPPPAATAVAAAPPATLADVHAAEEELAREKANLEEQKAEALRDRDAMLAEFDEMVVKMETMTPPEHLSREEIHTELMRVAAEVEGEMSSFVAEADPVILERMAMIAQRIRRRASDFGAPPPPAQRFRALQAVRYALNGTIHTLAKGSIVSGATHSLEALRAAHAQLEEVTES